MYRLLRGVLASYVCGLSARCSRRRFMVVVEATLTGPSSLVLDGSKLRLYVTL